MQPEFEDEGEQRLIGSSERPEDGRFDRALRPTGLAEYVGQPEVLRAARYLRVGGPGARGSAGPRADLRPAGARQDHPRARDRQRDGRGFPSDLRPGAGTAGRSCCLADQSRAQRCPVHRRDSSAVAGGRGSALSGARGLSDRYRDRRGAGGAFDQARSAALHAGRRHHARRGLDVAAARSLWHRAAPGVLFAGRSGLDRHAFGRDPGDRHRARRRRRDRASLARYAACGQPAAAACARLRGSPCRRPDRRRYRGAARWTCCGSTTTVSMSWTANCWAR